MVIWKTESKIGIPSAILGGLWFGTNETYREVSNIRRTLVGN